ncbi:MAG: type II toxin-antitoxin system VapC family toxin [Gemmatimonadota bacterium]|nr:type II toxin-antitoxin system VapC family toxin [Gemmatimonadota bacterium]
MIHLDTSFLIRSLERGSPEDRQLRMWVMTGASVQMSAIAWAEFQCGPLPYGLGKAVRELVTDVVPLAATHAEHAAMLFNAGGRRRSSLPDCLIAACAIESSATLATTNLDDFRRFVPLGLRLAE